MKIMTTYKTKIRDSHSALANTVGIYRQAVDFLIGVALEEWNALKEIERSLEKQRAIECVIHHTKSNPSISIPDLANSQVIFAVRLSPRLSARCPPTKATMLTGKKIRKVKNLGFQLQGISTPLCIETTALFVLAHIQQD